MLKNIKRIGVRIMRRKDNNNGLSAVEYRQKTVLDKFDARFYCTANKELANELIKLKKYLYFTEKEPHFKNKDKIVTVFYFEMIKEIHYDVAKIKAKLDEKYKNKKKKVVK